MKPTVTATIEIDDQTIFVRETWNADVDRKSIRRTAVRNEREADRLIAAINSQAAVKFESIETDNNGRTYVECRHLFRGRTLNADLKALGY